MTLLSRRTAAFAVLSTVLALAAMAARSEPIPANQATVPPAPAAQPEKKIPELDDAIKAFGDGDYAGALTLLREAAKKNPELPAPHVIMAQLFARANAPAAVRTSLDQAVMESPADPEAYLFLGELAVNDGRITEADLLYTKAEGLLKTFAGNPERKKKMQFRVYSGLAAVAQMRGDWAGAQKQLEAWLALDPKNTGAMLRLAQALFQQKKVQEALDRLKAASALDEKILKPGPRMGQFYEEAGDREAAKKWMVYGTQAYPNDFQTQLVAARWAVETNQLDLAVKWADAALKLDSNSLGAKLIRGLIAWLQNDYKTAESYFQAAHLQSPGDFMASNNLALALVEQDDPAKRATALQYAESNARQYSNSPDAASTYGWVLYKLGRLDDAVKVLGRVAASRNITPDSAYYIARVTADKGNKDEAKKILEMALNSKGLFANRKAAEAMLKELSR